MILAKLVEQQCDDMATGTQMREFLRDDDGNEPFLREMLRMNLEQFAGRLLKELEDRKVLTELVECHLIEGNLLNEKVDIQNHHGGDDDTWGRRTNELRNRFGKAWTNANALVSPNEERKSS